MKDWKNIQEEIKGAKEPLSPAAWEQMDAMLNTQKGGGKWKRGLLLLLLFIAIGLGFGLWNPMQLGVKMEVNQGGIENANHEKMPKQAPKRQQEKPIGSSVVAETSHTESEKEIYNEEKGSINEFKEETTSTESSKRLTVNTTNYPLGAQNDLLENGLNGEDANTSRESGETLGSKLDALELLLLASKAPSLDSVLPPWALRNALETGYTGDSTIEKPSQKAKDDGRLELRFYMGSTYNLPNLEYKNKAEQTHKQFNEATNDALKPGWGIDAGFELKYRVYKNLRLSAGFTYRELVTTNNYNFEFSDIPVIDSATGGILGYIPASQGELRQESSSNMYSFLTLPISLYYEQPVAPKWTITGEAINNISFLVHQSGYEIDPTSLELENTDKLAFNKVSNSLQLRLGLRYQLSSNFYLALEPAYRRAYQDLLKNESMVWKPADFSLNLSAIVKLK